jgi:hypothetical protein
MADDATTRLPALSRSGRPKSARRRHVSGDRLPEVLHEALQACGDRCVDETSGPIASEPSG